MIVELANKYYFEITKIYRMFFLRYNILEWSECQILLICLEEQKIMNFRIKRSFQKLCVLLSAIALFSTSVPLSTYATNTVSGGDAMLSSGENSVSDGDVREEINASVYLDVNMEELTAKVKSEFTGNPTLYDHYIVVYIEENGEGIYSVPVYYAEPNEWTTITDFYTIAEAIKTDGGSYSVYAQLSYSLTAEDPTKCNSAEYNFTYTSPSTQMAQVEGTWDTSEGYVFHIPTNDFSEKLAVVLYKENDAGEYEMLRNVPYYLATAYGCGSQKDADSFYVDFTNNMTADGRYKVGVVNLSDDVFSTAHSQECFSDILMLRTVNDTTEAYIDATVEARWAGEHDVETNDKEF